MMAAATGALNTVTDEDRTRRLMRFLKRRVEEYRPIMAGAMPEGARLAASSTIVVAYAPRSVSPQRHECQVITGRFALGLHFADRPPGHRIEPVQSALPGGAGSVSTNRRERCAPARCASTCRRMTVDDSVTSASGTIILGVNTPTMQGLIDSGVTSTSARVRARFACVPPRARIERWHPSRGRQTERRRRRTARRRISCSPNSRKPANQTNTMIRMTGTARRGTASGGVDSDVVATEGGDEIAGEVMGGAGDLVAGSTSPCVCFALGRSRVSGSACRPATMIGPGWCSTIRGAFAAGRK